MPEQWESYITQRNERMASVAVDVSLQANAPDSQRPWLLSVVIQMLRPYENGLSSQEEAETLWSLEDALMEVLSRRASAVQVGRVTSRGKRELHFYADRQLNCDEEIKKALRPFAEYPLEWKLREDPQWTYYFSFLHPSDDDSQHIKNERTLEVLERHGDAFHVERDVSHWFNFSDAKKRDEFSKVLSQSGAVVRHTADYFASEEPYGVQAMLRHAVDADSINRITDELRQAVKKAGGTYDGWETPVIKPS